MTPNPPPRHGNQQGSVSAKDETAPAALRGRPRRRATPSARSREYLARRPRLPAPGSTSAGVDARGRARAQDLAAYQSDLFALRKKDGKPYSAGSRRTASSAVKSLFRFLYRRGYVLHDPRRALELPRRRSGCRGRSSRREEARRISRRPTAGRRSGCATARSSRRSTRPGSASSELAQPHAVRRRHRGAAAARRAGKGSKDRNVPLTPRRGRGDRGVPREAAGRSSLGGARSPRLFLGALAAARLHRGAAQPCDVARAGRRRPAIKKHVDLPHLPPQRGDASPQGRRRHPPHPGAPRPRLARDDRALHARRDLGPPGGAEACAPAGPVGPSPRLLASLRRGPPRRGYSASAQSNARFNCPRLFAHSRRQGVRDPRAVTRGAPRRLRADRSPTTRRADGTPLSPSSERRPRHGPRLLRLPGEEWAQSCEPALVAPSAARAAASRPSSPRRRLRRVVHAPSPLVGLGSATARSSSSSTAPGSDVGECCRLDLTDLDLRGNAPRPERQGQEGPARARPGPRGPSRRSLPKRDPPRAGSATRGRGALPLPRGAAASPDLLNLLVWKYGVRRGSRPSRPYMPCGTPARRTSWPAAPTSAMSRSSLATEAWRRRPSTRGSTSRT